MFACKQPPPSSPVSSFSQSDTTHDEVPDRGAVTCLLQQWQHGDTQALNELWPHIAGSMRRIAARIIREHFRDRDNIASMHTTELIQEAFPRILDYQARRTWDHREQFYALVRNIMLWIILDYKKYQRYRQAESLHDLAGRHTTVPTSPISPECMIALDQSRKRLAAISPRAAHILELRFYQDYSIRQITSMLGLGRTAVHQELKAALGFLKHDLDKS